MILFIPVHFVSDLMYSGVVRNDVIISQDRTSGGEEVGSRAKSADFDS
jgi:hypothetical protein